MAARSGFRNIEATRRPAYTPPKAAINAAGGADLLDVSLRRFFELANSTGFPAARTLGGPRTRRWVVRELLGWLEAQPAAPLSEPEHLRLANQERRVA